MKQYHLSEITAPLVYEEKNTIYRIWDNTISNQWDFCKSTVRVVKSDKTKTVKHHAAKSGKREIQEGMADLLQFTNLPSVVSLKNVMSICHARWQIENECYR